MSFDVGVIRSRFPALSTTDNKVPRIYFDNPGGTQVTQSVVDAMSECLLESNANVQGSFVTSQGANEIFAAVHLAMADLLNAWSADEIVFGQNMTTLTMHMSRSIGRLLESGDEIVLSQMDHDANVAPWLLLARDMGLKVRWLPFNTETYEIDRDALDDVLSEKTKLVCAGLASNLIGTINDVQAIAEKARAVGAMTYIDAVQGVPHVSTDVQALGCDFLVCSAYKFFGPHQGILWGRGELLQRLEAYKVRPAPKKIPDCFETGTQSHEGMAGTTAAVDYFSWLGESMASDYHEKFNHFYGRRQFVHAAMECLFDYEKTLALHLISGLKSLTRIRVHGVTVPDAMHRRVPTVSFEVNGTSPDVVAAELGARNIFVWSGHNYAVEAARHLGIYDTGGAVRVGPVHYNTMAEIDTFLNALEDIIPRLTIT